MILGCLVDISRLNRAICRLTDADEQISRFRMLQASGWQDKDVVLKCRVQLDATEKLVSTVIRHMEGRKYDELWQMSNLYLKEALNTVQSMKYGLDGGKMPEHDDVNRCIRRMSRSCVELMGKTMVYKEEGE